jgi:hypothetical protein
VPDNSSDLKVGFLCRCGRKYLARARQFGRTIACQLRGDWVIGAVMIAVVVVTSVIAVLPTTRGPQPPAWVLDQQIQKIDYKTLEIAKESHRDWMGKYAPDASGRCKNPKTGEYSMVDAFHCRACGKLIPVPEVPPELRMGRRSLPAAAGGNKAAASADPRAEVGRMASFMNPRQYYKCPRCGKSPFESVDLFPVDRLHPGHGASGAPDGSPESLPSDEGSF